MDLGLKGKIALVTGAGSQVGFGKAICMLLAKEGCDIIASDIDLNGTQQTVSDVEKLGRRALAVKCDITSKADVEAMIKQALEKFGRLDILVNNAGGIAAKGGAFETQNDADWDKNYFLNLKGPMLVTQAVYAHMAERKYGKIIFITSDTTKLAPPPVSMYTIAKAGLVVFARQIARVLAEKNINVNCVSPGWSMDTNFVKGPQEVKDNTAKRFMGETPLGKGTTTMDIASAVVFLVSDISGDVTGQVFSVSGGSTMQ
jgi:3-oxoacyl-[acyl-carrier protein] reductase